MTGLQPVHGLVEGVMETWERDGPSDGSGRLTGCRYGEASGPKASVN